MVERGSLSFGQNSLHGASAGSSVDCSLCGASAPQSHPRSVFWGLWRRPGRLGLSQSRGGAGRGRKEAHCCGAGAAGPGLGGSESYRHISSQSFLAPGIDLDAPGCFLWKSSLFLRTDFPVLKLPPSPPCLVHERSIPFLVAS